MADTKIRVAECMQAIWPKGLGKVIVEMHAVNAAANPQEVAKRRNRGKRPTSMGERPWHAQDDSQMSDQEHARQKQPHGAPEASGGPCFSAVPKLGQLCSHVCRKPCCVTAPERSPSNGCSSVKDAFSVVN